MADPATTDKEQTAEESFLRQFVGEGKKYRSEEELAKAYANADRFIQHLTTQTDELKSELDKRMAVEDFIKQTTQQDTSQQKDDQVDPNPGNTPDVTATEPKESKQVDESELIERIKAELRKEKESESADKNLDTTINHLREVYGDDSKVNEVIKTKAAELGVSVDYLQDTAAKSPSAFYRLIGVDTPKTSSSSPRPALNSAGMQAAPDSSNPQPGTKAYFDNIRKTDPSKYFSRKIQLDLYQAAARNPAEFGLSN